MTGLRRGPGAHAVQTELPVAALVAGYLDALDLVVDSGFAHEVDWQERCRLENLTETRFLREAAWVILSSGMSVRVVHSRFPKLSRAFLGWSSADRIVRNRDRCRRRALQIFHHFGKVDAICSVATFVAHASFARVKAHVQERGVEALSALPYIGPITKFHLAKNIGIDVAKPDRHLVRLARSAGVSGPQELCRVIAEATGDRIATVDLVLWRYATLDRAYAKLFGRTRIDDAGITDSN